MATRKSLGSVRNTARPAGSRERSGSAVRRRRPKASSRIETDRGELLTQLIRLAIQIRGIYGTALAAQLALRRQAADHDVEIADCLRQGVCNPMTEQAQRLELIIEGLGGEVPEPLP